MTDNVFVGTLSLTQSINRHHSSLSRAFISASFQRSSSLLGSFLTVSLQFVSGRTGFLLNPENSLYIAWCGKNHHFRICYVLLRIC